MESIFAYVTSGLIGLGLSAACGFRVFVPLCVMSFAAKGGLLQLSDRWAWVSSGPALIALSIAVVIEVIAFLVPYFANLLDAVATPAAVVAGTITTAACVSNMDPLLQWSLAIIAGAPIAGVVQAATVATRWTSTATTGGLADSVVAALEAVLASVMSVLAILVPIIAAALFCTMAFILFRLWRRRRKIHARQAVAA